MSHICCECIAQARGEIDALNERLEEKEKALRSNDLAWVRNHALKAKLSQLERVRVAAEHLYYARLPKCDCPKDGGGTCFACELKAALRLPTGQAGETEGKA